MRGDWWTPMNWVASLRSTWPRRAPGLPPGQRRLDIFPRFSDNPLLRPPLSVGAARIEVRGEGITPFTLTANDLARIGPREQTSDFHCVTTWTHRQVRWTGLPMTAVWKQLIAPRCPDRAAYVVAIGADEFRAVYTLDDLLGPDVLVTSAMHGEPLEIRHGAPLRLVSPSQYGYKSVKHFCALEIHFTEPPSTLGPKEHLRARVALEERHSRIPARLLRWPYRLLVPLTITVAERTGRMASGEAQARRRPKAPEAG